jgi:hypothetical protein
MTNVKTLVLAAVAALTIGAGSAMTQSYGPSDLGYMSATPNTVQAPAVRAQVPAGSSDFEHGSHAVPFNGDYGDLPNPG